MQWIAPNQMDSIYAGDNVINNGQFGYNNMQQVVGTWTHKFNDKIYTATEAWYMWEYNAIDHPTAEVPFQSGSFPVQNGYAPEWAVVNYTMFRIAPETRSSRCGMNTLTTRWEPDWLCHAVFRAFHRHHLVAG